MAHRNTATRDTDWFTATIPASGVLTFGGDAEFATYLFELGPPDCGSAVVMQNVTVGPFVYDEMVITGEPGSEVWLWAGPTTFEGPVAEYDYLLLLPGMVATENRSWSGIKALYD